MKPNKEIAVVLALSIAYSVFPQKEAFALSWAGAISESRVAETCALISPVLSARHRLLVTGHTTGALLSGFHHSPRTSPTKPPVSTPDSTIDTFINEAVQRVLPPASIVAFPKRYIPGPIGDHRFREEFMAKFRERVDQDDAYLAGSGELIERIYRDSRVHHLPVRAIEEIFFGLLFSREVGTPRFSAIKEEANLASLKILGWLDDVAGTGPGALRAALIGNSVGSTPLWNAAAQGERGLELLAQSLTAVQPQMVRNDEAKLLDEFSRAPKNVLYFVDNAMEITFDLAFVRWLVHRGHKVTLVGRESDANVDMTAKDLRAFLKREEIQRFFGREFDLSHWVQVISSGSRSQGTDLRRASRALLGAWATAEVVIAKGEGNSRTLSTPGGLTKGFYSLVVAKSAVESGHMAPGTAAITYFRAAETITEPPFPARDVQPASLVDSSSQLAPQEPPSEPHPLRIYQEPFTERVQMRLMQIGFVGIVFSTGAFLLMRGMILLVWDKLTEKVPPTDTDDTGMLWREKVKRSA